MSTQYISATSNGNAPVLMLMGNSLPVSDFLTAANPSSVNGLLGSEYVINDGSGAIMLAPNAPVTTATVTATPSVRAAAWSGACVAMDPVSGQTYSAWKIILPTSNLNTAVFSAGQVTITSNTVQVPIIVTGTVTAVGLTIAAPDLSQTYFTANDQFVTANVSLQTLGGVSSDLAMKGVSSEVTFSVLRTGSSGPSDTLMSVNTLTSGIRLGSTSEDTDIQAYGTMRIDGTGSATKFVVTNGVATYFAIDTISSQITIKGATELTGALRILSGNVVDQLTVYQTDGTTKAFNVDSITATVNIGGVDLAYPSSKFIIRDNSGAINFGVSTDSSAGHPNAAISVANITPLAAGLYNCGSATRQFAAVYAVNGTIQTSDMRLKNLIQRLEPATCLQAVERMSPLVYDWKADPGKPRFGMFAQEIRDALVGLPENSYIDQADPDDPESTLLVNDTQLLPLLVGAIKNLSARLAALEAR